MRSSTRLTLTIASTLSLLVIAAPALAATPAVERSRGALVDVAFTTTDAISCAGGGGGIRSIRSTYRGDEDVFSGSGYSVESSLLQVSVSVTDSCTGTTDQYSGAEVNRYGSVLVAGNGRSATGSASLRIYGGQSTDEGYAFSDVGLTLTANGRPVRSLSFDRVKSAGGVTYVGSIEKARSADVSGTFVLTDTGAPYLDGRNLLVGAHDIVATYATSRWISISH